MSTTSPVCVAWLTAVMVAEAPGASRPRLQVNGTQVPWEACREISFVVASLTLRPLTSTAATEERLLTVIFQVMRPPRRTVEGEPVLVTARSSSATGGGGVGVGG